MKKISVSVPGRICLFGEHQDYLKLPVITAAINLRVKITGQTNDKKLMHLHLPDIQSEEILPILQENKFYNYELERDYFKSVANVLKRSGLNIKNGCDCTVRGNIPINSGTSSSSALNVAWVKFLIELNNENGFQFAEKINQIAYLAYLAEVEEFGEPGGMMDHYATAIGGVLFIDFIQPIKIKELNRNLGDFILGDSMEPKDTKEILHRVKFGVLEAVNIIKSSDPRFNLKTTKIDNLKDYDKLISSDQKDVLMGAIYNRDFTQEAKKSFEQNNFDHKKFGQLLTEHQKVLANKLKISTKKIDLMLKNAIDAGAFGGKINGSGGGGCMFVYAPENTKKVAQAIEAAGGKAYIVKVDDGIKVH